jgi:hypothetical protein
MHAGCLSVDAHADMVKGTCLFADSLYSKLKVQSDRLVVASKLIHADQGTLCVMETFGGASDSRAK